MRLPSAFDAERTLGEYLKKHGDKTATRVTTVTPAAVVEDARKAAAALREDAAAADALRAQKVAIVLHMARVAARLSA